jgi:hypothetical protein
MDYHKLHLDELLNRLQSAGYTVGIEEYKAVSIVLQKVTNVQLLDRKQLCSLLRPIFAKNQEQQDRFDYIFDNHFRTLNGQYSASNEVESVPGDESIDGPWTRSVRKDRASHIDRFQLQLLLLFSIALVSLVLLTYIFVVPRESRLVIPYPTEQADTTQNDLSSDTVGVPRYAPKHSDVSNKGALLFLVPDIREYQLKSTWLFLIERFKNHILLSILTVVCVIGVIIERRINHSRKLLLREPSNPGSSLYWPVHLRYKWHVPLKYQETALSLSQNASIGDLNFHPARTISHALQNWGFALPQFTKRNKIPRYLLLLDAENFQNHHVLLIEKLFQFYRQHNVRSTRFFFDNSAASFWNERFRDGVDLRFLCNHFSDYRLIILSDALKYIDSTGTLYSWTTQFKSWDQRVLLSTKSPADWGKAEQQLGSLFNLHYYSADTLHHLAEAFSANPSWQSVTSADVDHSIDPASDVNNVKTNLIRYFKHEDGNWMLKWVAACCLYPNLQWDLTVLAGTVVSPPGVNLVTVENMFRLSSLRWFKEGKIPNEVRAVLVADKQLLTNEERREIFSQLLQVLQSNQNIQPGSVEYHEHQLNILISQYFAEEVVQRKDVIWRKLQDLEQQLETGDFIMLSQIRETRLTKSDLFFLGRINELFKIENPIPRHLRSAARMAFYLLVAVASLSEIDLSTRYYDLVALDQKSYYLDTNEKKAAFLTMKASRLYNYNTEFYPYYQDIDRYLDSAYRYDSKYLPAVVNKAIIDKKRFGKLSPRQQTILDSVYTISAQDTTRAEVRNTVFRLISTEN